MTLKEKREAAFDTIVSRLFCSDVVNVTANYSQTKIYLTIKGYEEDIPITLPILIAKDKEEMYSNAKEEYDLIATREAKKEQRRIAKFGKI